MEHAVPNANEHDQEMTYDDASGDQIPGGIALGAKARDHEEDASALTASLGTNDATERLERVRDLLFGEQVRRQNQRFEHIETFVEHEMSEMRSAIDSRLLAFEQKVRDEIEAAQARFSGEQERALGHLSDEQEALSQRVQEQQDTFSQRLDEQQDAFAHRLDEQQEALSQRLTDQYATLDQRINDGHASLHEQLIAERDLLAQRLTEGHNHQAESMEKLARAVRNLAKTTQASREEMARRVEAQLHELRSLIHHAVSEVRHEAAARQELAAWFDQMADQLRAEKPRPAAPASEEPVAVHDEEAPEEEVHEEVDTDAEASAEEHV